MMCLTHRKEEPCESCAMDIAAYNEKAGKCISCEFKDGNNCKRMIPYSQLDLMIKAGSACPVGNFSGDMPSGGQVAPKPQKPRAVEFPDIDESKTSVDQDNTTKFAGRTIRQPMQDRTPRPKPPSPDRPFRNRFGSALEHVIPNWLPKSEGCNCSEWRIMLDKWGHGECVKRRGRIFEKLMDASNDLPLLLRSVPKSIREKTANSYLDKAYKLSDPNE